LEKKIYEGIKNYSNDEIIKMEKYVCKNLSWHGLPPKELFKRTNMEHGEIERYYTACGFLHIRESPPISTGKDDEFYAKTKILECSLLLLGHIKEYITLCPTTLSQEAINYLDKIYSNIEKTFINECSQKDQKIFELIQLIPVKE